MMMSFYDREVPCFATDFCSPDDRDQALEEQLMHFLEHIISECALDSEELSFLSRPFRNRSFRWPSIFLSEPPMFRLMIFLAKVDWIMSICQTVQEPLDRLLQLRDQSNRGPAHFAASSGKFQQLCDAIADFGCGQSLIANAVEADIQGLLAIHYASCTGTIDDVQRQMSISIVSWTWLCKTKDSNSRNGFCSRQKCNGSTCRLSPSAR
jgi:hypothetical protein